MNFSGGIMAIRHQLKKRVQKRVQSQIARNGKHWHKPEHNKKLPIMAIPITPAIVIDSKPRSILVKYPTRNRPKKFLQTLKLWIDRLSGRHNVRFIISIDDNDTTMLNPTVQQQAKNFGAQVEFKVGKSRTKIEACNVDVKDQPFDILILASDDMLPIIKNYDDVIATSMETHFPNFDGLLHFYDGYKTRFCTLPVMGKRYYDKFGYIYEPSYKFLSCDVEMTEVAKKLGKYLFIKLVIVKHVHPRNTRSLMKLDALNKRDENNAKFDRATYNARQLQNFNTPLPKLTLQVTLNEKTKSVIEQYLNLLNTSIIPKLITRTDVDIVVTPSNATPVSPIYSIAEVNILNMNIADIETQLTARKLYQINKNI